MKANGTRAVVLLAFLIALGAGAVGGMLLSRLPMLGSAAASTAVNATPTSLTEALQLTPQQAEQMRSIWEKTRAQAHIAYADAQELQKGRDDALVAILNDEQKAKYEKIAREYADRFSTLTAKRDAMFQKAVEQTRTILSPAQQTQYEEVLRSRLGPKMPTGKDLLPSPVLLPDTEPDKHR